jgi:hypothetical protein
MDFIMFLWRCHKKLCSTMMVRVSVALILAFASAANAWVISKDILQKVVSGAAVSAALLTTPLVSYAAQFDGSFSDPKHPNCLRVIKTDGAEAKISGTDGTPGCPPDGSGKEWFLVGKIQGDNILVDFSPKGGPTDLKGVYDKGPSPGILWPDGNKWSLKN